MKVALVHNDLTQRGKAEQEFELLAAPFFHRERNFYLFLSRLLCDQPVSVIIEALNGPAALDHGLITESGAERDELEPIALAADRIGNRSHWQTAGF